MDPKAKVAIKNTGDLGILTVKLALSIVSYDAANDPVIFRLYDPNSQPLARQAIGTLSGSGTKWQFKSKNPGVQRVLLEAGKTPGQFKLTAKTKRWFTSGAADDPVASHNVLTVWIGSECFTLSAPTRSIDRMIGRRPGGRCLSSR